MQLTKRLAEVLRLLELFHACAFHVFTVAERCVFLIFVFSFVLHKLCISTTILQMYNDFDGVYGVL